GGCHRILDGDIDPDSSYRRHGVGRIADEEQPGPPPLPQEIDHHGQKLHVIEAVQLADAISQERRKSAHAVPKRLDAFVLYTLEATLRNDVGTLPVLAAVQHDQHRASVDMPENLSGIALLASEPKPKHVHRSAEVIALQSSLASQRRMPPVAADNQIGTHGQLTLR